MLGIVTPVFLQNERLLNLYLRNLETYTHPAGTPLFLVLNRLTACSPTELLRHVERANPCLAPQIIADGERSVAGAWNCGVMAAMELGCDVFHVTAQDVAFDSRCLDRLLKAFTPAIDVLSSCDFREAGSSETYADAPDFSSFFLSRHTIDRHGWFDREFKPAYYEDNDYAVRVQLGGGRAVKRLDAAHYHYGSATISLDAEARHHVAHWGAQNKARFASKWGGGTAEALEKLHRSPFGLQDRPLSWWPEQDRPGYRVNGFMHE